MYAVCGQYWPVMSLKTTVSECLITPFIKTVFEMHLSTEYL